MCARSGSAVRLKADSHPTGGRASVVTAGDAFEVGLGDSDKRSALWVRSTEVMSVWALKAAPAPDSAVTRPATVRQFAPFQGGEDVFDRHLDHPLAGAV